MQSMLKTVVTDGTGKKAAIDGFSVAGKTSTAEIYDEENGGYRKNVYNLAFTAFWRIRQASWCALWAQMRFLGTVSSRLSLRI